MEKTNQQVTVKHANKPNIALMAKGILLATKNTSIREKKGAA